MRTSTLRLMVLLSLAPACVADLDLEVDSDQEAIDFGDLGPLKPLDGTQYGNWALKPNPPVGSLNVNYSNVGAPNFADANLPDSAADAGAVYVAWKEEYLWRLFPDLERRPSYTDHEPIYVRRWQSGAW